MGLDMNLTGQRFFSYYNRKSNLKSESYDLGYWRKHPDLHGYIVQHFADGIDECQRIDLSERDIRQLVAAIKDRRLPRTTGFFFGESEDTKDQIAEDVDILEKAIAWLNEEDAEATRYIYYCASW